MTAATQSSRSKRFLLLPLLIGLAICVWFRGPFFGVVFFVPAAVATLFASALLERYAGRRTRSWVANIAIGGALAYLCTGPPTTRQIFTDSLGCPPPPDLRDLRRYDDLWGIDPAHFLRFRASADSIARFIAACALSEVETLEHPTFPMTGLGPDWWRPRNLRAPRVWRGNGAWGWFVELWYSADDGLAYLYVSTS